MSPILPNSPRSAESPAVATAWQSTDRGRTYTQDWYRRDLAGIFSTWLITETATFPLMERRNTPR